jgi:hypothetical protein
LTCPRTPVFGSCVSCTTAWTSKGICSRRSVEHAELAQTSRTYPRRDRSAFEELISVERAKRRVGVGALRSFRDRSRPNMKRERSLLGMTLGFGEQRNRKYSYGVVVQTRPGTQYHLIRPKAVVEESGERMTGYRYEAAAD